MDDAMYKGKIRLYGLLCFLVCLLLTLLSTMAATGAYAASNAVRVGWIVGDYNNIGKNGERSGYGYEYQRTIVAHTGWEYEYVEGTWTELLAKLRKGEIDLMSGVSYTDERAKEMLFSELSMSTEKYYIYADLRNTDINPSDVHSFDGKRIGVLENSILDAKLRQWEKTMGVHVKHVPITGGKDIKNKLVNREMDGFVSLEKSKWAEYGAFAVANIGNDGVYFVINKKRPDLKAELDNAMRRIAFDKPFYAENLHKKYFPITHAPVLSREEAAWLKRHGVIQLGYLKNDFGISEYDEASGKPVGIINDYVKFASTCLEGTKLDFELIGFDTYADCLRALKEKKVCAIFHTGQNEYAAEKNEFILSDVAFNISIVAVTAKNDFRESVANTVAVEKDDVLIKEYIANNYPKWEILECASSAEVEKAVLEGKADCFVMKLGEAKRITDDKRLHSVLLVQMGNGVFAVNRHSVMLLAVLDKTLKAMPKNMLTSALTAYESASKKMTLMDFVYEHLPLVLGILIAFLLVILLLLHKSKQAEARAVQSAQEAEEANKAKSNFLFNMSHDIRTPMNAILGYARMIKEEADNPKRLLEYQEKIEQSGKLLLSIINNVLDMARIENNALERDECYSRVSEICSEFYDTFEIAAKQKKIKLELDVQVEHDHVMSDTTKLKEIFTNLISNAIKYTPAGGKITVRCLEEPCPKEGYVRIKAEVIDNGIGMSEEFLPRLFESFSRERNTTAGRVAGTGLGMAIVKRLVDFLGGTISVESELGKGTKFTVVLDHKMANEAYYKKQEQPKETVSVDVLAGKRLLMAEDNELNAEIASFVLEELGLIVERVEDGVQCVGKISAEPAGTYDLILMDIQMPNMNGYEATEKIRRLADKAKANIPIVAMTANAFAEDKQNALEAGMNGHIAKPIDVEKVKECLVKLLS